MEALRRRENQGYELNVLGLAKQRLHIWPRKRGNLDLCCVNEKLSAPLWWVFAAALGSRNRLGFKKSAGISGWVVHARNRDDGKVATDLNGTE